MECGATFLCRIWKRVRDRPPFVACCMTLPEPTDLSEEGELEPEEGELEGDAQVSLLMAHAILGMCICFSIDGRLNTADRRHAGR